MRSNPVDTLVTLTVEIVITERLEFSLIDRQQGIFDLGYFVMLKTMRSEFVLPNHFTARLCRNGKKHRNDDEIAPGESTILAQESSTHAIRPIWEALDEASTIAQKSFDFTNDSKLGIPRCLTSRCDAFCQDQFCVIVCWPAKSRSFCRSSSRTR